MTAPNTTSPAGQMKDRKDDEVELIDVTVTRIAGFYPIAIGEDQYGRNVQLSMPVGEVKKLRLGERFRCRVQSLSLTAKIESRLPAADEELPREAMEDVMDERVTLKHAAELLHVPAAYAQKLAIQGKLGVPSGPAGYAQTFSSESVNRARVALKASQRAGLEKMVDASVKAGLYDDELRDLPTRKAQQPSRD
ncbi:hypothetical protein [Pseudorhodoferax sp. Leaf265]|uniref:hypothetical protein n=1 Tax=Pseudorhodoferax sp. Leaf265 TaxID=1736315 RepID=UPI0012E7BBC0|nr:hypothetical protein [Pseudorhodoferax sp. Leaf265]